MKENAAKFAGVSLDEAKDVILLPLASFEMQQDRFQEEREFYRDEREHLAERHESEKEKMRKHYRTIIAWISAVLLAMIVGVFGTAIWFLSNYEITDFSQDSTYGNANFIGNDGDISNGEANYYNRQAESEESSSAGDCSQP